MRFAFTILYVADVMASISFYEKAFGFARKFVTPENDYGELETGATVLAFASLGLGESNFNKSGGFTPSTSQLEKPFGIEVAFTTEQIQVDFDRAVKAGATVYKAVEQKPLGHKVGYVRDINGFLIEICTPIKAAK